MAALLVIALLSPTVRPLSANVRPRGSLLSPIARAVAATADYRACAAAVPAIVFLVSGRIVVSTAAAAAVSAGLIAAPPASRAFLFLSLLLCSSLFFLFLLLPFPLSLAFLLFFPLAL